MHSLWNDDEAAGYTDELQLRAYSSRLLGQDPSLVLHGGGNTSVKIRQTNLFGEEEEILHVKGSGWDLASIEPAGFTPLRIEPLLRLAELETLSDSEMVNQLKISQTRATAPTASVEAILHALLPYRYVDHTHADAIIAITNTPEGEALIRQLYDEDLVIIPYVMPGFELAREVRDRFARAAHPGTQGMVLMNHGLFSFGDNARESYERMIGLVDRAERFLQQRGAWELPAGRSATQPLERPRLARLRRELSESAGFPAILSSYREPEVMAFCQRDDLAQISQQGPATPDHVIRTKRLPLLGRDLAGYVRAYHRYFERHAPQARNPVEMLDPAPRVLLDPQLGLQTLGRSAREAQIVADIYRHTMAIIQRAERLGGWRALPESAIFEVEYWELEQAKLRRSGQPPLFQGEIALITGGASGIGRACVEAFLARGAAVVALDLNPSIEVLDDQPGYLGLHCDVTDPQALEMALDEASQRFGGLDMLVLNAGIFPGGCRIAELSDGDWRRVMEVNLDANLRLLRSCYPLLREAPRKGRVVVIGSKNVPAPGIGAAAYSASKAALNQLARVATLEWAADGMRINSLHPDAVFDTGLWSDEILAARAAHYGMSVEAYKRRNLLETEVRSRDVAELAAELCGPLFGKTTGAQIPVDGGNDRVV